jgi:hypothetical protein
MAGIGRGVIDLLYGGSAKKKIHSHHGLINLIRRGGQGYMKEALSPFTYICECGKKWVFAAADVKTTRRCDCGRTMIVERQAVYTEIGAAVQKTAVASGAGPIGVSGAL